MASYEELHTLFNDELLLHKIEVAIIEAARIIAEDEDTTDPPWDQTAGAHDDRVRWAALAITQTGAQARNIIKLVLAQNKGSSVAVIQAATDASIQSNVNIAIDVIAKALGL